MHDPRDSVTLVIKGVRAKLDQHKRQDMFAPIMRDLARTRCEPIVAQPLSHGSGGPAHRRPSLLHNRSYSRGAGLVRTEREVGRGRSSGGP